MAADVKDTWNRMTISATSSRRTHHFNFIRWRDDLKRE